MKFALHLCICGMLLLAGGCEHANTEPPSTTGARSVGNGDSARSTDDATNSSPSLAVQNAQPLPIPRHRIIAATAADGQPFSSITGVITSLVPSTSATEPKIAIQVKAENGDTLSLELYPSVNVPVDLEPGRNVSIATFTYEGFEGTAQGIRITDADGIVYLADDGDYGPGITAKESAPFAISQKDAGCRNRGNTPMDMNNFYLVVEAGKSRVELIQGDSRELITDTAAYTVVAARSTAVVDGATWTDAPYSYISYVIARNP